MWGEGEHKQEAASLVAPAAPRTNYPEQPYYDYADAYPETNFQSQAADRWDAAQTHKKTLSDEQDSQG